ncbi:MAG: type II toxin-antitoxin system PemK/MazF family toxin [Methanocalculus sp.]|uniref:type II toxin-antitoxin system PemK/MazF family toxin n=1 Tax=Methanocalculus sp. TaxID=2004547 RepID=UPI0027260C1F|nr:type II toxin-antitoxin system PemK/MazF family toxin [Methanocalculus sp.]MDO8841422.1 type II toxin-antitoxin system PemK/MazF family toxin [Methanocalculus sp.]MDO9540098.1 type II toxin-antitoxin system PemK/MazF family toxin [Methanocalculus sp.]
MNPYRPRDVVIVPFPFQQGEGKKNRPAVVLAVESDQLLLAPCTRRPADGISAVKIDLEDFEEGGLDLFEESSVLIAHHAKVPVKKVVKKKGRLNEDTFNSIIRPGRF